MALRHSQIWCAYYCAPHHRPYRKSYTLKNARVQVPANRYQPFWYGRNVLHPKSDSPVWLSRLKSANYLVRGCCVIKPTTFVSSRMSKGREGRFGWASKTGAHDRSLCRLSIETCQHRSSRMSITNQRWYFYMLLGFHPRGNRPMDDLSCPATEKWITKHPFRRRIAIRLLPILLLTKSDTEGNTVRCNTKKASK